MAIVEKARVAGTRPDGSKILLPETETRIRHKRTGHEYANDDDALADVYNPTLTRLTMTFVVTRHCACCRVLSQRVRLGRTPRLSS